MVNVMIWVFWLSLAVILLSELKFWDVLRGQDTKKTKEGDKHWYWGEWTVSGTKKLKKQ